MDCLKARQRPSSPRTDNAAGGYLCLETLGNSKFACVQALLLCTGQLLRVGSDHPRSLELSCERMVPMLSRYVGVMDVCMQCSIFVQCFGYGGSVEAPSMRQ